MNGLAARRTALGVAQARHAARLVRLIADRCADTAEVAAAAGRPENSHPAYGTPPWEPTSLAHGYPGTATLYGELARYDPRWAAVAHEHLKAAARALSAKPVRHGLFEGPAAVASAAQVCAGPDGHYRKLLSRLVSRVAADQLRRLARYDARRAAGQRGMPWDGYDVISGLSGTGRLLLDAIPDSAPGAAVVDGATASAAHRALTATLHHLVRLAEPIEVDGASLPGWWVPPGTQPAEERRRYPRGHFNLGMAHGAAGPLALLALAAEHGISVPGQLTAIHRFAEWLMSWAPADGMPPCWPSMVTWDEETSRARQSRTGATRNAWCYGTAGVAAALYRAGACAGERTWRQTALNALRALLARDEREWGVDGPSVCHGYAGLLAVLHRIGTDAGDEALLSGACRVAGRVLGCADEDAPFVFPDLVPDPVAGPGPSRQRPVDAAGLLEGAAGIGCALLPAIPAHMLTPGADSAPAPAVLPWDRVLMLA